MGRGAFFIIYNNITIIIPSEIDATSSQFV
jgi:hypothetical protein